MASGAYNVGAVVAEIKADLTDFKKGMSEAKEQTSSLKSALSNVGDSIVSFGKQAAVFTGVLGAGLGIASKYAIDGAAKFEQYQVAFTTLLKDQTKAAAAIKAIQEDAAKTPFELAPLVAANQRLISAGVSAADARKQILNLGDAISATGGGNAELERLSTNLQQIKAVGKASALDIKQFAFAGINVYQMLADSMGKNVEQIRDMDITYEDLTKAFEKAAGAGGMFEGAMQTQSQTLNGLMSALRDTISLGAKDILMGTGAYDALRNSLAALIPMLENGVNSVIAWVQSMKQNEQVKAIIDQLVTTFTAISDWVAANQELVMTFLTGLGIALGVLIVVGTITALLTALLNPLTLVALGVAALYTAWKTNFMGIQTVVNNVITWMVDFWNKYLMPAILAIQQYFIEHWDNIKNFLISTWDIIKGVIQIAWSIVEGILKVGLAVISGKWDQAWQAILQMLKGVWEGIKSVLSGILGYLSDWGKDIFERLTKPIRDAWDKISELMNKIKEALDFTQRHSPSIMDIINKSVRLANDALSDLNLNTNITTRNTAPAFSGSNQLQGFGGITVNLDGAIIANDAAAMDIAETIGDQIIKKLNLNIRS